MNDQDEDTDDSGETQIVHTNKHNIGLELQQNSVQRFCEDDYGAEIEMKVINCVMMRLVNASLLFARKLQIKFQIDVKSIHFLSVV